MDPLLKHVRQKMLAKGSMPPVINDSHATGKTQVTSKLSSDTQVANVFATNTGWNAL